MGEKILPKMFFLSFLTYLFIWLGWVLVAARGVFVLSCKIFCCGARTLAAASGHRSVQAQWLQVHELSYSVACGILAP